MLKDWNIDFMINLSLTYWFLRFHAIEGFVSIKFISFIKCKSNTSKIWIKNLNFKYYWICKYLQMKYQIALWHMNIIPKNRPGNDCHLHLIGKSFTQRSIPLLSPSHDAIPIGLQYINHQNISDIEINKQNEETTIQAQEKKFNSTQIRGQ